MKLCIDCKHYDERGRKTALNHETCTHPKNLFMKGYTSRVTGRPIPPVFGSSAVENRKAGPIESRLFGLCGKEGRRFEPKESTCSTS
jgi:hypothetical protein